MKHTPTKSPRQWNSVRRAVLTVRAPLLCGALGLALPHSSWAQVGGGVSFRQQPESRTVCTGSDVTLHVELEGLTGELAWLHDGSVIPGATGKSLVVQDFDPASDAGLYVCVATTATGGTVSSQPAVLAPEDGHIGQFPLSRSYGGPNPWCPLCPHPPIIDPIGMIIPGAGTTIDLISSQGAAVRFVPSSVDQMSTNAGPERLTFSATCVTGAVRQEFGQVQMSRRDGVGLPWWLYGVFDGIPGVSGMNIVVLSGGAVLASVPADAETAVQTAFFPDALSNVSKKFDWAPKLEGGKEGYSCQWRQPRPVMVNGVMYQADEVQFVAKKTQPASKYQTLTALKLHRDFCAPGQVTPELSISGILSKGDALPGTRVSSVDAMHMRPGRIAEYNPATVSYLVHNTADQEPDLLPFDPGSWGGPLVTGTTSSASLSLNFTKIDMPYRLAPAGGGIVWTECETAPAAGLEARLVFTPEGSLANLNGLPPGGPPPALRFTATGRFSDASTGTLSTGSLCDLQQVGHAPGTPLPVRLHVGFDLADFTLEVKHNGVTQAAWPCAGGPVINLPDWLKDIKLSVQTTTTTTGAHIPTAILTCRFGDPLPQPWACQLEVNGVTVTGDELVFTRENLPSPAPAAPVLYAIERCAFGGHGGHIIPNQGGGAGKVQVQDFTFTLHRAHGHGQAIATVPDGSPGMSYRRGLPPDFDDGTTVFDPFGPQPMAIAIVPTPNGMAINRKGTGADKNRIIPAALPPVASGPGTAPVVQPLENAFFPTVQRNSIKTKGTGASGNGRLVAPADGDGTSSLSLSFDECDAWEAEFIPLMPPGTQPAAGSTFTLTAHGTLQPISLNGLPPGEPILRASLGSLTGVMGSVTPSGQPVSLTPDFTPVGRADHRIRIKHAGAVLLDIDHRTGEACTLSRLPRRWGKLGGTTECFYGGDPDGFEVTLPGVAIPPIMADEIEILLASSTTQAPSVLAKTDVTVTCQGWAALSLEGAMMKRGKRSEAELNLNAIERSPVNSLGGAMVAWWGDPDDDCDGTSDDLDAFVEAILSPRDIASGQATGKRSFVMPHVFEQGGMVCDSPPNGVIVVDADGALGTQFTLTRADQSGPECGVNAVIEARYKIRAGQFTGGPGTVSLQRTPSNACVISPDFSGLPGEIEVMSWSWGESNPTTIGSSGLSHGRFATTGLTLETPVWPSGYGAACVAEGVLSGDIVWLEFPAPTEVSISGTVHVVSRLAFLSRPVEPLGFVGVGEIRIRTLESAKVSMQDFHFVMPPPPVQLTPTPDGGFTLEAASQHAVLIGGSDMDFWDLIDTTVAVDPTGSVSQRTKISPEGSRGFFQALGRRKGWDGTVKGR